MKLLALALALMGLLFLLIFIQAQKPIKITSPENLSFLQENQKVLVQGKVLEEQPYFKTKLLILENNIVIICNCPLSQSYKNKNISALGFLDVYADKTKISALKISLQTLKELSFLKYDININN
ncbi:MAG: hypothetical protein AABX07_01540 [Nanoarchaeota archaeon]